MTDRFDTVIVLERLFSVTAITDFGERGRWTLR